MRSLFRFLVRNHVFLLFLLLEIFSMVLIFNYNNYQKVIFLNSSNRVTASVYGTFNKVVNYFRLSGVNEELAAENSNLRNRLSYYEQNDSDVNLPLFNDSTFKNKYYFTSARIINNTVNKQYNYITLNKGRKDGIKPDQGIISGNGIVGIVNNVSESYSTAISLLNQRLKISGKIKKNNYFGSVAWDGTNYQYVELNEIPPHVELVKGDTIVTSGSSAYFPEGVLIGTIDSFELKSGESFYTIRVKLAVDFKSITYVDVIENRDKSELKKLENLTNDDQDMD